MTSGKNFAWGTTSTIANILIVKYGQYFKDIEPLLGDVVDFVRRCNNESICYDIKNDGFEQMYNNFVQAKKIASKHLHADEDVVTRCAATIFMFAHEYIANMKTEEESKNLDVLNACVSLRVMQSIYHFAFDILVAMNNGLTGMALRRHVIAYCVMHG